MGAIRHPEASRSGVDSGLTKDRQSASKAERIEGQQAVAVPYKQRLLCRWRAEM